MNTKHKIEVMQAFLDGKTIQMTDKSLDIWEDFLAEPYWNWEANDYRIKPAEPKKVKLLAWMARDTGHILYRHENIVLGDAHHVRLPKEDKEVEIAP